MKKKIIIAVAILVLVMLGSIGCGNSDVATNDIEKSTNTSENKVQNEKVDQEELNQQIKDEAIQAEFVTLNVSENEAKQYVGKSFFIEGEVTFVDSANTVLPEFTVTTKEENGYGMYTVINLFKTSVNEGDTVKVYGGFNGVNKLGMPELSGNVIEIQ